MDPALESEGRRTGSAGWRAAGTIFLYAALVIFIATFVVAARTPVGTDTSGCRPAVPCDPSPDPGHRQTVFFIGMGTTLVVLAGGVILRSVANRA